MMIDKGMYTAMVDADVEWLTKNTEDCLERQHIIDILKDSINEYYDFGKAVLDVKDCDDGGVMLKMGRFYKLKEGDKVYVKFRKIKVD